MCHLHLINKTDFPKIEKKTKNNQEKSTSELIEFEFIAPCVVECVPQT